MGSAAAWQLSRSGRSVVLLEQFEAGHHIGASHGATRNFNTAYAEADYLDLLAESKTLWDELAAENGAPAHPSARTPARRVGDRVRSDRGAVFPCR